MAWFLMLLAVACFAVPFLAGSVALGVLCLLLSLVLVVTATMMLLSARINGASRDLQILSAEELRALREQTETRAAADAEASAASSSTTPESPRPNPD